MTANPHAARSLRARFRRWDPRHWTSDDGLIGQTVHDDALFEEYRPGKQASSPSALQQFAVCPYRYALRSILELHPMVRPTALRRMDPITRGQVFHTAQWRVLSALQSIGVLPLTKSNLDFAAMHLDAILSSLKEEFAERLAPAIPQVWDAEWEAIRSDLRGWLMFKAERDAGWTPEHFEWSFGLGRSGDRDASSVAEPVQIGSGYRVKGAIDLIERSADGALRVVDHKTGKPPEKPVMTIGAGEKLQPALYAMAVQEHFKVPVRGGRLFYCTLRGNYKVLDVFLSDDTREAVDQFYLTLDSYMRKGFFPAAPREGACARCDYQAVCGPWEEERTSKKPQAELRGLTEIRELP
jgi:ATP-dependent helicase/nuclease subunit B